MVSNNNPKGVDPMMIDLNQLSSFEILLIVTSNPNLHGFKRLLFALLLIKQSDSIISETEPPQHPNITDLVINKVSH